MTMRPRAFATWCPGPARWNMPRADAVTVAVNTIAEAMRKHGGEMGRALEW